MSDKKKVLAICGSTRQQSSNASLLKAIGNMADFELELFEDIATLPHFNPDLNGDDFESVCNFSDRLKNADGVIICTPEYAHGVPGSLKNAIDWTVGTGEFSHKPTFLITASTDGSFAHPVLLETLKVIEAKGVEEFNLLIQYIRTKINNQFEIIDPETKSTLKNLLDRFTATL